MLKRLARFLLRDELNSLETRVQKLQKLNKKSLRVSMDIEIPENTDVHNLRERIYSELRTIPSIITVENLKYSSC